MPATIRMTIVAFLIDSIIWGVWFGGLWMYRAVLAARLSSSYTHVALSTAMPLAAASSTYILAGYLENFVRRYRVGILKVSVILSRTLYLLTSYTILTGVLDGLELLYTTSIGFTAANSISSLAVVAWADYVADNIPPNFKSRYIALDSILSTVGALIGTSTAGALLYESQGVVGYGKLFTVVSAVFLAGAPILVVFVREFSKPSTHTTQISIVNSTGGGYEWRFYLATIIIHLSVNLSTAVAPPFIIYRLGGNEIWIALINGASQIASLVAPMAWSLVVDFMGSLNATKIATALAVIANAALPFMPKLHLQIVRAFLAGASGIGIWITLFSYLVRDVDSSYRIRYVARVFTIQNLVPAVAMNLGGALADVLGAPEVVFILSLVGLTSLTLL